MEEGACRTSLGFQGPELSHKYLCRCRAARRSGLAWAQERVLGAGCQPGSLLHLLMLLLGVFKKMVGPSLLGLLGSSLSALPPPPACARLLPAGRSLSDPSSRLSPS